MRYNDLILERFKNPTYAGGLRGGNGTGKAGDSECGDLIKLYLSVDEDEEIKIAKFKTYGRVCSIVASDIACEMIEGKSLESATLISAQDILNEMGDDVPESRQYSAYLAEEAIKSAIEDYYKKRNKKK